METTPCGLHKFNPADTYSFADSSNNFKRPDELLARLGAHSSRFFQYSGIDTIAEAGVVIGNNYTPVAFHLLGEGEWFFVRVEVTVNSDMPRNGSKLIASMPAKFSAMHTQKLASVSSGRGVGGWVSQSGQIQAGSFSGSDSTIKAGERIQLAGWYLPKNDLLTVGIPTVREKSPFFSEYLRTLDIIDSSCELVQTNMENTYDKAVTAEIRNKKEAWIGGLRIFTASDDFDLGSVRYGLYGDLVFLSVSANTKKAITIPVSGSVSNVILGSISWSRARPIVNSPMDCDNSGRMVYPYATTAGNIGIGAFGRAGGSSSITVSAGEGISVAGYLHREG